MGHLDNAATSASSRGPAGEPADAAARPGADSVGTSPRPDLLGWLPLGTGGIPFWSTARQNLPHDAAATDEIGASAKGKRAGFFSRLSWRNRLLTIVALSSIPGGAAALGALLLYFTATLPHPLSLRNKERAPVVRVLARDGAVLAERGAAHDYVPLDMVPRHVRNAVVATEDRRFFEHHGIDPWGLIRAAFANLRAGRAAQGGSTLTQQLAKNLFLSPNKTMARKFEELALAVWLETRLSKADILELYLNQVYFGGGAYGIEAAAQRYFDKPVRQLTLGEAAIIAGLLKAPSKYSPASSPGAARARGRLVLERMLAAGVITEEEARRAMRHPIRFAEAKRQRDLAGAEYAVEFVLERLPRLIGSGHGEVIVETTIDAGLQTKAQAIVEKHLAKDGAAQGAGQAAVVVLDLEGHILALVGGRNHATSEFNRAAKARRQPGSAFKPFVYLAALEKGATPDTIAYDQPLSIGGWSPRNDNGRYQGPVSLRQAITQSINTVAVRLAMDVGPGRVAALARRLGIASDLREEPSLALGTSEVTLLELAGAYDVLASGGLGVEPRAIRRIRLGSGRVLYASEAPTNAQLVAPELAGAIGDMLHSAVALGTGRRAAIPGHAAAGKTGTTQDFRDAWFVGYTGQAVAGVWVGNDNGAPMRNVTGGGLPAMIWHDVMLVAHAGKPSLPLPAPPLAETAMGPNGSARGEILPWSMPTTAQPAADGERTVPPARRVVRKPAGKAAATATAETTTPAKKAVRVARRAAQPRSTVAAPQQQHPKDSIDADLIARALKTDNPQDRIASSERPMPRPEGLMSLGGKAQ